jgi:hypothetical protein
VRRLNLFAARGAAPARAGGPSAGDGTIGVVIREDAERIARELFAAYPATPLRDETPAIYGRYLAKLDLDAVARLIPELIETSPRLPTIADIRRRIVEAELLLPNPLEAYHSLFERPAERHPLTRYVADIFGGDYNIRTSDAPGATRAQFMKFYEEVREEALRRGSLPRIVVEAAARAETAEPASPEQPSVWTAIQARFDELPGEERAQRLKDARRFLLKERELSPDWLAQPVVEHEALRLLAEENGWLESEAVSATGS